MKFSRRVGGGGIRRGIRGPGGAAGGPPALPVAGAAHRWVTSAASSIVQDGSGVVSWTDVVGGVVLARTGATGPTLEADGQITKKTISFADVAGEPLRNVGGITSTVMGPGVDSTVIVFGKRAAGAVTRWFGAAVDGVSTSTVELRTSGDGTIRGSRAGTDASSGGVMQAQMFNRVYFRWDDAGNAYTFDGNKDFSDDGANLGDPIANQDTFAVGSLPDGSGRSVCSISEVIIYPFRLTDEQLSTLDDFLINFYFADVFHELGATFMTDPDVANSIEFSGQDVTSLTDLIGGAVLTQSNVNRRPTVITSTHTGRDVLLHAQGDFLFGLAPAAATMGTKGPGTMFAEVVMGPGLVRNMFSVFGSADPAAQTVTLKTTNSSNLLRFSINSAAESIQNRDDGLLPEMTARWVMGTLDPDDRESQATGSPITTSGTVTVNTLGLDSASMGANSNISGSMIGEIGLCLIYPYKLSVAQRLRVTDAIEARWSGADIAQQLGANMYLVGDDATLDGAGGGVWPDRIGGPDFLPVGSADAGVTTINGRQAVSFDPGGDSAVARTESVISDLARTGPTTTLVVTAGHVDTPGDSQIAVRWGIESTDENMDVGWANTAVARVRYRDTGNATNSAAGVFNTDGNRHVSIYNTDPSVGADLIINGTALAMGTATKALATPFTLTAIGARWDGTSAGSAFRGQILAVVTIPRRLNDRDVALLTDYGLSYFDWAAAEGQPGAIDGIFSRWRGSDYVPATGNWPAFEGSSPTTLVQASAPLRPAKGTATELGDADVVEFDGVTGHLLEHDFGSIQPQVNEWFMAHVCVRRGIATVGRMLTFGSDANPTLPTERISFFFQANSAMTAQSLDSLVNASFTTTEGVIADETVVALASFIPSAASADVVLNGVLQQFADVAVTSIDTLRYLNYGNTNNVQLLHADVAESIMGLRVLGRAEQVAFARYADAAYLDPAL